MHGADVAGALPQGRVQVMRGLPLSAVHGAGAGVAGAPPQDRVNDVPPEGGIYIGARQRM